MSSKLSAAEIIEILSKKGRIRFKMMSEWRVELEESNRALGADIDLAMRAVQVMLGLCALVFLGRGLFVKLEDDPEKRINEAQCIDLIISGNEVVGFMVFVTDFKKSLSLVSEQYGTINDDESLLIHVVRRIRNMAYHQLRHSLSMHIVDDGEVVVGRLIKRLESGMTADELANLIMLTEPVCGVHFVDSMPGMDCAS
jgi:hypothetical protein